MSLIFKVLIWIISTGSLPVFIVVAFISSKLRASLPERLGFGGWSKLDLKKTLWIHAASLGELQGVEPLLKSFRTAVGAEFLQALAIERVLITTTSLTGQARARELLTKLGENHLALILPVDHPLILRRALRKLQPKALLIFETEIWPALYLECYRAGVPICIINGRISDSSFPNYKKIKFVLRPVLQLVDRILVQTLTDQHRFLELGAAPDSVVVAGSTKYERKEELDVDEVQKLRSELFVNPQVPVFVCGSVRPGELEILLDAFRQILGHNLELQLLVAPRHPEFFQVEETRIISAGYKLSTRSKPVPGCEVFLLDSLGELRKAYATGDICFVGGTLVAIGGHNPMEPAELGRGVVVGPFVANVKDAVTDLLEARGAITVSSSDELSSALVELLRQPEKFLALGAGAKSVADRYQGAGERVVSELRRTFWC